MSTHRPPVLVIIGPTASGKSDLAVDLAHRYSGEVISADSRQVYTPLFYTTGKISREEMKGIPHHMLDVLDAGEPYSAHLFAERAVPCVEEIYKRSALPIVTGGTGFYIDALLYEGVMSGAPCDPAYRKQLQERELSELQEELREQDPDAYERIDIGNPRRVIRALEIIREHGCVPETKKKKRYEYRMIGIQRNMESLRRRITERLNTRLDPMIDEIQSLLNGGVDPVWLDGLGLECRYISRMLTQDIPKEETRENLLRAIIAYAKRQNTWWRRYTEAVWFQEHQTGEMRRYLSGIYGGKK